MLSRKSGYAVLGLLALALVAGSRSSRAGGGSLNPGDILIADSEAFFTFADGDPFAFNGRGGIFKINPVTGSPTLVSQSPDFVDPVNLALEGTGASRKVLVVDQNYGENPEETSGPGGALFRVDPTLPPAANATLLSSGGQFVEPRGVAVGRAGTLFVADTNGAAAGKVIAVDPATGAQTLLSSGGLLVDPTDLVYVEGSSPAADRLYLVDSASGVGGSVIAVDPATGAQVLVSTGQNFVDPVGISAADSGLLYVSDEEAGPSGLGAAIQVNPAGLAVSNQTVITTGASHPGLLEHPRDVAVETGGTLLLADPAADLGESAVVRVDPSGAPAGAQTLLSDGDFAGAMEPPSGPLDFIDALGIVVVTSRGPVVEADKTVTAVEDTATPLNIPAPTDPDNDPLTLSVNTVPNPALGEVRLADGVTPVHLGDSLTVAQLTGLVFAPAPDQTGAAGTFTYTADDGTGNTASQVITLQITPVNDAPTLSNVADQSIPEDGTTGPLAVTVGDVETPAGSLVLSAGSSNPALVPNANIVLGGSGANRTVTVTPVPDQSGATTITLTVLDADGASATDTFVVNVSAVNDPPAISNVADQAIAEDTSTGPLPVTVGDAESPAASLALSGSSSNPALLPNANIVFGGAGASRTVTLTPAPDQSGTAVVTLTVTDPGGGTATHTFILTVTPVNDPPTLSNVADQTIAEDTSTGALAFTVGDLETSAGSLVVSASSSNPALVPNAGVVLGGSGANRTVTVTPAPNQFGATTITLTVADGQGGTATDTFVVTVTPVPDPPIAVDDCYRTVKRQTLTVPAPGVLANDPATDSGIKKAILVKGPSHGTVSLNQNGSFTYTPHNNYTGLDEFTYRVNDGSTNSSIGHVVIGISSSRVRVVGNGALQDNGAAFSFCAKSPDFPQSKTEFLTYTDSKKGDSVVATKILAVVSNGNKATLYGFASVDGGPAELFELEVQDNHGNGNGKDKFRLEVDGKTLVNSKTTSNNSIQITIK